MATSRTRWIGLLFISLAISLVIIDGTIVNTIFPEIIRDLGLTSTEVQWVQESYVLVFASTLLIWGSLADRIGRRRLLLVGILIFVVASVWAGSTDSASSMILARVVQGFGGAMVLPTTLSLVNATFQGRARNRVRGLGVHHRGNGRRRPRLRWLARHRLHLAVGIPYQRASGNCHHGGPYRHRD